MKLIWGAHRVSRALILLRVTTPHAAAHERGCFPLKRAYDRRCGLNLIITTTIIIIFMDIRTVTNHNTALWSPGTEQRDKIKQKQSNDQILNPTFPSLAVIWAIPPRSDGLSGSLKELKAPAAHYCPNPQRARPPQAPVLFWGTASADVHWPPASQNHTNHTIQIPSQQRRSSSSVSHD